MEKHYNIILKSGVTMIVTPSDLTRSPIGLWKWSLKQIIPQTLDFEEGSILSSEIAVMHEVHVEEQVEGESE